MIKLSHLNWHFYTFPSLNFISHSLSLHATFFSSHTSTFQKRVKKKKRTREKNFSSILVGTEHINFLGERISLISWFYHPRKKKNLFLNLTVDYTRWGRHKNRNKIQPLDLFLLPSTISHDFNTTTIHFFPFFENIQRNFIEAFRRRYIDSLFEKIFRCL